MLKRHPLATLALITLLCTLIYAIASASRDVPEPEAEIDRSGIRTLGGIWDPEAVARGGNEGDAPWNFDIEEIHENLKQLELDRHGHIKLNGLTQRRLEEALSATGLVLTEYDLQVLQASIQDSLPDEIGREASALLLKYFRYLRAQEQILKSEHLLIDLQDMKARQASLSDLRVAMLGADTAKRLFRKVEDDRNFMLESMALSGNGDLSPEERTAQIERLGEQYHRHAPPIEDWNARSQRFLDRLRASGTPADELKQNAYQLLIREFSEEEVDLMREYQIDLFEQLGASAGTSENRR